MTIPHSSPKYDRKQIADAILDRLDTLTVEAARRSFSGQRGTRWFAVDDLLPKTMAEAIRLSFPKPEDMRERRTIREHKFVAAQMDRYDPQGEEALFAFQDPQVVARIAQITELTRLLPDAQLYAGGLSLMTRGNFLNPHVDNSHNSDRSLYRVLNLLYYCSPDWKLESGGNLELWPDGLKKPPLTIPSLFNRFVVMTTGHESWHSVSRVLRDEPRCCVSNYYFSPDPLGGTPYFRVTSFRGRPEQPVLDFVLRGDTLLRQAIRKLRPQGVTRTTHIYERPRDRT